MGINWSEEQRQVIELRDRNILVSAAAGSGKTAVLVERIIQKITDLKHPVDVDRLLIVTFTKAAAAEMRERLGDALEERLGKDPENENLQRQLTLLHNAQITTIDSFCLYVVQNYFHKIDLEPGFRVGDAGEMKLMKEDVLEEVMIEAYEREEEDFIYFADYYTSAKNDKDIVEMVNRLFEFAQSHPWPEKWLDEIFATYEIDSVEQMEETAWMKQMCAYVKANLRSMAKRLEHALVLARSEDGPYMYINNLESDLDQIYSLEKKEGFQELQQAFAGVSYTNLSRKQKYAGSLQKKEYVREVRDQEKKRMEALLKDFFYEPAEDMLEMIQKTKPYVKVLLDLTKEFGRRFSERKREKNIIDYSDMEHLALQILVDEKSKEPTEVAVEFQNFFDEIMIDEYQDSNMVQETILTAISKMHQGHYNIFMVGDVKQSIYRFRMARPELFMEKYERYTQTDSPEQKIDLHKNFRSRIEIIQTVNDVFRQIMQEDLGRITYDEQAELKLGADFEQPKEEHRNDFQTEVLLVDRKDMLEEDQDQDQKYRLEARMVAARIRKLMEDMKVTEKGGKEFCAIRYSDIVLLFRSSNMVDTFLEVLAEEGIPAHAESKTGYFSALEVQTVLNALRVMDNPMQDIPLTAVLTSPIVGLSGEDLAKIRIYSPKLMFAQAVFAYGKGEKAADPDLYERVQAFQDLLKKYRDLSVYLPVHELIETFLTETGYEHHVASLPGGVQKSANIRILIEKAIAYERTSYRGLFHFVRYIEKLEKYEVDFGEADLLGENDDVVRISSIHKSKGLEFPVVFVCGMGKKFNMEDMKKKIIPHPELGIGMVYVNGNRRIKTKTIMHHAIERQVKLENLGEELRVLYVALTRAKEKLILTGTVQKMEEKLEKIQKQAEFEQDMGRSCMDHGQKVKAMTYLDWVLPVLCANQVRYKISCVKSDQIKREEMLEAADQAFGKQSFLMSMQEVDPKIYEKIETELAYTYPYQEDTERKSKVSVSELKHRAMEEYEEEVEQLYVPQETEEPVPKFLQQEKKEASGSLKGSAFHRAMECLDFTKIYTRLGEKRQRKLQAVEGACHVEYTEEEKKQIFWEVKEQLQEQVKKGRISQELFDCIYLKAVVEFFESSLGIRMCAAAKRQELYRERPFVMGLKACEIDDTESEELVLVQGIIDGFFYEKDRVIVMDYKTDRIQDAAELIGRYQKQICLYSEALERITGRKVTEKILYSSYLKQEIRIEDEKE